MHYGGQAFEVAEELRDGLEAAAKMSANDGSYRWLEFDVAGQVARFLVGPGIPIAFISEPDAGGDEPRPAGAGDS